MRKFATLAGIGCLCVQSLFGALVPSASTPSMSVYEEGTEKLTVYTDVPGSGVSMINGYTSRAKSDIYEIWVRSAASNNQWVQCFANMTYNRALEMPQISGFYTNTSKHAYQKHTAGWTHTYANIEMSDNSPVEVEIRKIGGTLLNGSSVIVKSAVHPWQKIVPNSKKDENGRVYFKIDKPCQMVIDINGQMDDHNAAYPSTSPNGRMPSGSPVHSLAIYANPIMVKPVSGASGVRTVSPSESSPTTRLNQNNLGSYTTLVFAPGIHNIGPGFKVYPGKNYYIPGDAIVYGNMGNSGVSAAGYRCSGDSINIYGYGTICGIQIPHYQNDANNPEYPEWNSWVGKGQGVAIEISDAWDTKITGVTTIDPANFNTRFDGFTGRTNDQGLVSWVKLHSWRVNGDGFGGYAKVHDSFIRAADDSTYVRDWRRRCTFWKDTNANIFRFINHKGGGIEDCDIIYARWRDPNGVGSIFEFASSGGPQVVDLNLVMRNIRFHDKLSNPRSLFSMELSESYRGLVFENISSYLPMNGKKSVLKGSAAAPWFERLVFKNITYKTSTQGPTDTGTLLTAANFNDYFETNEYVANVLFDHPRDLTITTVADPAKGTVSKSPDQATYVETTLVTLTATPEPNHVFTGWSGFGINASNATSNPLSIRVLDNGTITANFSQNFNVTNSFTTPGTYDWVCPPGVTVATIECRGGGGAASSVGVGSGVTNGTTKINGGGGAGGNYAKSVVTVVPGTTYKVKVGAGGVPVAVIPAGTSPMAADPVQTGGASAFTSFDGATEFVKATGGVGASNMLRNSGSSSNYLSGGIGSLGASIGDVKYAGGSGANGGNGSGGGGGAGAGYAVAGANASGVNPGGGTQGGGSGGYGRGVANGSTNPGAVPGGGGGSTYATRINSIFGGAGGRGQVVMNYIEGLDHFEISAPANPQAGTPFDVTITAKDLSGATALRSLDSLTVNSPGGNLMEFDWNGDGIYGDNSGVMTNGVKIIKARNKRAESVSIVASYLNFTTSPACNVTIVPAAFATLQVLLPGETAAPGTATGKTGTPSLRGIGISFQITVNAVDAYWNPISTVTDTVRITSSDPAATLPANLALVGGTRTFTVTQNSVGSHSLTATNMTTGSQTPATSSTMIVQGFTWMGDGTANRWTVNPAALNWTEPSGALAAYTNGRLVNFNDSSTNQNVDIEGVVTPGSVAVDGTKNYTIVSSSGGSIGGSTGFTKNGSGSVALTTANTYTGNTLINAGTVRAGNNSAFGSTGSLTLGNTSASLELADGITINRALTVSNTGDRKFLTLQQGALSAVYSGTISNVETTIGNFHVSVGTSGSLNLSGAVNTNTLTKVGDGTLIMSGAADNNTLFIDAVAGEVQLGKTSSATLGVQAVSGISGIADGATVILTGTGGDQIFGGSPSNHGVHNLAQGGVLDLNGNSESISYLNGTNSTSTSNVTGGVVDGGSGTPVLTVGESNVSTWFPGEIVNTSGTLSLVKVGTGMLSLTGVNTYGGSTEIRQGAVTIVQADDRLPTSTTVILGSGTNSATLRLGSGNTVTPPLGSVCNQTLAGLTTSGSGTSNAVIGGNTNVSTLTLNNSGDIAYNGRLGGNGTNDNQLALTKTGTGTFTLSGTRSYTGPTLVQAGTLALVGGSHASPITVAAGASLGFNLGTPAASSSTVNLAAGSVKISGTVDNVSNYKLMTASSFTGPLSLDQPIEGYSLGLKAGGTELWLIRYYSITTTAANGVITLSPPGGVYETDTTVTVSLQVNGGYRFTGWSGDASGNAIVIPILMNANKSITANFIRQYVLTTVSDHGSITLNPPGGTYDENTTVTASITVDSGYRFTGWSGAASGNATNVAITMDGNKTLTAEFIRQFTLTASATNGTITLNPPGGLYDEGTSVSVSAVATDPATYRFSGWNGALSGTNTQGNVLMDGNKTVAAIFSQIQIVSFNTVGTHDWTCPEGVTGITVECRGGGGAGGSAKSTGGTNQARAGGGAGGSYAKVANLVVTPGTTYKVIVGAGGVPVSSVTANNTALAVQTGGTSRVSSADLATDYVKAVGGAGGRNALKSTGGALNVIGGAASSLGNIGDAGAIFAGGSGGNAGTTSSGGTGAGGGGGGAGNAGPGGTPSFAITGGAGGTSGGGAGGTGRGANGPITSTAGIPGGGGGAVVADTNNENFGGAGGRGSVVINYVPSIVPSPWQTADIGAVAASGSASYANSTWTIEGSGADIWHSSDEFRYVHKDSSGYCSIVARVAGMTNPDSWAKSGVMIRESTAADSMHAMVCVTPGNGVSFQWRNASGAACGNVKVTGQTAPKWLKLTRTGDLFAAYYSDDNVTWTQVGTAQTISMSTVATMGMAVTSRNDGALCTSTVDSVTADP